MPFLSSVSRITTALTIPPAANANEFTNELPRIIVGLEIDLTYLEMGALRTIPKTTDVATAAKYPAIKSVLVFYPEAFA